MDKQFAYDGQMRDFKRSNVGTGAVGTECSFTQMGGMGAPGGPGGAQKTRGGPGAKRRL